MNLLEPKLPLPDQEWITVPWMGMHETRVLGKHTIGMESNIRLSWMHATIIHTLIETIHHMPEASWFLLTTLGGSCEVPQQAPKTPIRSHKYLSEALLQSLCDWAHHSFNLTMHQKPCEIRASIRVEYVHQAYRSGYRVGCKGPNQSWCYMFQDCS